MSSKDHLPWFRLYSETVDDPKLRLLAFEDRWHYVALLCCKCQGILDKETDISRMRRQVAVKLGIDSLTLEQVEQRLTAEGLIEKITLQPLRWDARQMRSDMDPTNAERQKRFRDGQASQKEKHDYTPEFEEAWSLYPDRPGCNKLMSFKAWLARLQQGHDAAAMTDGVRRYSAFCRAMKTEPRFIKQPATFFGPDLHFTLEWRVPIAAAGTGSRNDQRSAWAAEMTGHNGGNDDRSGDYIDVDARRV